MDTWKQMMDWKRMAEQYFGDQFFAPGTSPSNSEEPRAEGPLCNIYETAQELCCVLPLPGLNRTEDVEVFVDSSKLTVRGKLSIMLDSYTLKKEEFKLAEFTRVIDLPSKVLKEPVQAFYRKGLLFIRMLKDHRSNESLQRVHLNWVQE